MVISLSKNILVNLNPGSLNTIELNCTEAAETLILSISAKFHKAKKFN